MTAIRKYQLDLSNDIFGLKESALSEMYRKADLAGKPRAIVNVNVRCKYQYYVLFGQIKVVATGDIVEFTD